MMFGTPKEWATFAVQMGYAAAPEGRNKLVEDLCAEFPRLTRADARKIIVEAIEAKMADEQEMDRLIAQEDADARAAEHDLSRSMHRKQGGE